MLSLKNVKSPDSNFVNFPKVGAYGAEPKDYEVYDFVLKNYYQLRFSPTVATDVKEVGRNPKRVQRHVRFINF